MCVCVVSFGQTDAELEALAAEWDSADEDLRATCAQIAHQDSLRYGVDARVVALQSRAAVRLA